MVSLWKSFIQIQLLVWSISTVISRPLPTYYVLYIEPSSIDDKHKDRDIKDGDISQTIATNRLLSDDTKFSHHSEDASQRSFLDTSVTVKEPLHKTVTAGRSLIMPARIGDYYAKIQNPRWQLGQGVAADNDSISKDVDVDFSSGVNPHLQKLYNKEVMNLRGYYTPQKIKNTSPLKSSNHDRVLARFPFYLRDALSREKIGFEGASPQRRESHSYSGNPSKLSQRKEKHEQSSEIPLFDKGFMVRVGDEIHMSGNS